MTRKVRVRFAPSPTGPLHIGGVRTALFNFLFARKHGGDFLLRIEDTDQTRFVRNAENYIVESLAWCGLTVDEGIGAKTEGNYGPYRQSDRKEMYQEYAYRLVESGNAYYAFDTAEELAALRAQGEETKQPFVYNYLSRKKLQNSLTLSAEEVARKLEANEAFVIRFKMPENFDVELHDLIRGEVHYNTNELDDKVLYKSDGMPTYHLANVVDDYLMKISHVIRGEEWLSSMPLHVLLYKSFAWENEMPEFAHLPLILKPQGQGKLSKRDGDKFGFPVFPLNWVGDNGETANGYREWGFLPEAFVNMLALLGWNPGTEQEIFTMDELIQAFSLERVGKSGAKFDLEKTKWFNQQWLHQTPSARLAEFLLPLVEAHNCTATLAQCERICDLVKERAVLIPDLWTVSEYFFKVPERYDAKIVQKRWSAEVPALLERVIQIIETAQNFTSAALEEDVKQFIQSNNVNMGQIFNCLRLALVGSGTGAHLFDIVEVIGKQETVSRIRRAIERIPNN
ncbi:MAG: glutamate--tRNA ligase [Bacteroidales bacterium]|jgi:glutamyl-tRNA synthetase|nr:glutamate--tRNA ligase [Bacteroidales bacterium]